MTNQHDLDDRLFDCMLAEVEGHRPAPDLARRTLAAIASDTGPATSPARHRRQGWAAAALMLAAAAVVLAIAWSQHDRERALDGPNAPAQTPANQDPHRSPREWIRRLGDPDQAIQAETALVQAGAAAVPALVTALRDQPAIRGRVLTVLDAMAGPAVPALATIAELIQEAPADAEFLGPAFRAAATLAPFASTAEQGAARRALLITAFVKAGPSAGGAPNAAIGGTPRRRTWSAREVGRLLHRVAIDPEADANALIAHLGDDSPYAREFAAQLLGTRSGPTVTAALAATLTASHPTEVQVNWSIEEGYKGNFSYRLEHDLVIRLAAARSLIRAAGTDSRSAPAHAMLLDFGNTRERRAAAAALAHLDIRTEDRATVVAALTQSLHHDDRAELLESLTALARLEVDDEVVRARLQQLAEHDDPQIAVRAKVALRRR